MQRQIDYMKYSGKLYKMLVDLGMATHESSIGHAILDMVNIRASQLNGCAFCLDMHSKQAKIHGERELRLYHIAIWRESTLFTAKERAALEWTEIVTQLPPHGIPDEVFTRVREHLSEAEMSEVTFAIGVINVFNRLNIAAPKTPGSLDALLGLEKAKLS